MSPIPPTCWRGPRRSPRATLQGPDVVGDDEGPAAGSWSSRCWSRTASTSFRWWSSPRSTPSTGSPSTSSMWVPADRGRQRHPFRRRAIQTTPTWSDISARKFRVCRRSSRSSRRQCSGYQLSSSRSY